MRIDWRTIPHAEQRYLTSGDWFWTGETLNIRVSRMSDPRYEFCLGLHELVEAMLCLWGGVSQQTVDDFDIRYENDHAASKSRYHCGCPRQIFSNPGSDKHAPYCKQHRIADLFDYGLASILGVDLDAYDAQVDKPG